MSEPLSSKVEDDFHSLRAAFLEGIAVLEVRLDSALALLLGRGERGRDALYCDVIWRVPIEDRISLLNRLLADEDLADSFPFLEHARKVVEVRNILAHMILDVFESTDVELVFIGRRRGDDKERRLRMDHLRKLESMLSHVYEDLGTLRTHLVKLHGSHAPTPDPTELSGHE